MILAGDQVSYLAMAETKKPEKFRLRRDPNPGLPELSYIILYTRWEGGKTPSKNRLKKQQLRINSLHISKLKFNRKTVLSLTHFSVAHEIDPMQNSLSMFTGRIGLTASAKRIWLKCFSIFSGVQMTS